MATWSKLLYQHDYLAIAQGDVNYYSSVQKFGANFDLILVDNARPNH